MTSRQAKAKAKSRAVAEPRKARKRTRIQIFNEAKILDAALEVFAQYGFRGATVDQIAAGAGMSKPNLLYYFPRKRELYIAVLQRTLEMWLQPLEGLHATGDPAEELRAYIGRKLELSRSNPVESRLFATEIIQGAPILRDVLDSRVRTLVEEKALVIRGWIADGKIAEIDPYHLIFMIWAATQHYSDFSAQITAVLGPDAAPEKLYPTAAKTLDTLLVKSLL